MNNHTIKFVYDGEAESAIVEEIKVDAELNYRVTPVNKKLENKFGKTVFIQKKGEPLSGSPIDDLQYYSALKSGLEDYLLPEKKCDHIYAFQWIPLIQRQLNGIPF